MSRFDQTFKDTVRSHNDIVEVISSYVRLERRGNRYVGLCPFHGEKTPSFHVLPDRQIYHCFGCKVSGDVFKFIQEREHMTFFEALLSLAQRAGIPLPREERTPEEERAYRERRALFDALELGARFFHHQLMETDAGRPGLAYLLERGLTEETIRRFRLGWAPGYSQCFRALARRFPPDVLLRAGLIKHRREGSGYMDAFFGRVMFPITDLNGRVIGFGGRILEGNAAKYVNTSDTALFAKRHVLFGLSQAKEEIRKTNQAILVEGYLDVITPHQAGVTNIVAPLGTALTDEQCQLLRRQAEQVIVAFDADTAGQMATLRGLDRLHDAGCDVRVLRVPEGKDPDDFVRTHGPEAFRELLTEAVPLIEFKLRLAMERSGGQTPEAKLEAVKAVAGVLASIRSEVMREEYLRRVAEEIAGDNLSDVQAQEALRRNLNRLTRESFQNNQGASWNNIRDSGWTRSVTSAPGSKVTEAVGMQAEGARRKDPLWIAERHLLRTALHDPTLWTRITSELGERAFEDDVHQAIADAARHIVSSVGMNVEGIATRLLDVLTDGVVRTVVAEFISEPFVSARPQEEALDCMNTIKRHRVQRRIDQLQTIIAAQQEAGHPVDPTVVREWTELSIRLKKG